MNITACVDGKDDMVVTICGTDNIKGLKTKAISAMIRLFWRTTPVASRSKSPSRPSFGMYQLSLN